MKMCQTNSTLNQVCVI